MSGTGIKQVEAKEVLDSRGNPTVRAWVTLSDGSVGVASVPSGASTGTHEALELRDGGKRYRGMGVEKAVRHVNTTIARALKGKNAMDLRAIDECMLALDGTKNKKKMGANALLAVSLATARAGAVSKKKPLYSYIRQTYKIAEKAWRLPLPGMNIINGGRHADNGLSIQEFMIVPLHRSFKERVRIGSEVFHALQSILKERGHVTSVGDEGGFAPQLTNNEQAITYIMKAITDAGYEPGKDVALAMDWAASEFYRQGKYYFSGNTSPLTGEALCKKAQQWVRKYPIISLEDPLHEDDWATWKELTKALGKQVLLVGDDLFVTNVERLRKGIDEKVANTILIKVNQIGTLTETIDAITLAKKNGYKVFVSHRSGETADTFIADLAVAVNADFIKSGSLSRSERIEKYNRLMEIEDELGR